ncbi:divergent PAP2 family protein [Guptibacillus hwajinpoensis]|uniref:Acid phosphatase n=1 Tax=Guptibacillus hwajinpoensis TaxID=208199 RepID=A0A0J6D191_9BACL|nr:divergent PAP2 family protein [Alkalihalobacillus macyae]KMM39100.1 acid phosphatase [Alkalihalobacillus macyae]MDP4552819.1 divergent PAP2 family protein [Alkalihalobacillus macyae]
MQKMNRGILTAISSIAIAQGLKILTHKKVTGEWDVKQVATTGGMPSSHSAGVSALATYIAANKGSRHTETALAAIFGVIVMYDAQGIRRHTGEIARLVNELEDSFASLSGDFPSFEFVEREKELNEFLGHQPIEVLGGAILGSVLGFVSAKFENRED